MVKKETREKGRKVKRFWPQGNLLCGFLSLSLSLSLSLPLSLPPSLPPSLPLLLSLGPKLASHVKIANISKTKIARE